MGCQDAVPRFERSHFTRPADLERRRSAQGESSLVRGVHLESICQPRGDHTGAARRVGGKLERGRLDGKRLHGGQARRASESNARDNPLGRDVARTSGPIAPRRRTLLAAARTAHWFPEVRTPSWPAVPVAIKGLHRAILSPDEHALGIERGCDG